MIGNQKNKDDGYVNVSTKVSPNVAALLEILAESRGMYVYELLQLLIHGFISYAKADQTVPDEFRHLYESLKFDAAWCNAFNFCSPTAEYDIAQMILILSQPGRSGLGMAMIDKPFMDKATMTRSINAIYERVSELSLGTKDYVRLRRMNISLRTQGMLEAVRTMIDAQEIINTESDNAEELPGLGDRAENNRPVVYGMKTKKVKRRTPDGEAMRQQRIIFTDEDAEQAEQESKRDLDAELCRGHVDDDEVVKPFGVEW